jgi:hypothetical protein
MTELTTILGGIATTLITGFVTAFLTRKKASAEISKLQTEVATARADADNKELENARLGNEIIMENIVRPLEVQVKKLNTNISRLERAVSKIPSCPHSADCPVTGELRGNEKNGDGDRTDGK